jgi:hypothetical protein
MVGIRESISFRLRWLWILLGVALAVGIASVLTRAREATGVAWCRAGYSRATTAADTAVIDASVPPFMSRDAPPRVACGVLKSMGRL